jgi:hypothetical protein
MMIESGAKIADAYVYYLDFAPRLDFGYAPKPNCLGSATCSDFQGTAV